MGGMKAALLFFVFASYAGEKFCPVGPECYTIWGIFLKEKTKS